MLRKSLPAYLAAGFGVLLFAACREPPALGTDTLDWRNVGERAFAVEVPNASAVTGAAVHEWRVLIAFGTAPDSEEPQYTLAPPGSLGAVVALPYTGSHGGANADFRKNSPTEYELRSVYPPTGPEPIDRIGYPHSWSRWEVTVKHPNAAGGGRFGTIMVTVRHREVGTEADSAWLAGKVLLEDSP